MTLGACPGWYRAAVDALITDGAARPRAAERAESPMRDVPEAGLTVHWLGRVGYRAAWDLQRRLASARAGGRTGDHLLLLEHPPVLTLGRHADASHILAPPEDLVRRDIDVIRVERGGEVTYHGPGQLVAYPIIELSRRGLLLRPLVRALEAAMADACAAVGVSAGRRDGHPGCWCDPMGAIPRKIGALGIRVERGVSYHGIALNVTTDLRDFELIDPCGMPGLVSTSIEAELRRTGQAPPASTHRPVPTVAEVAAVFARSLAGRLGCPLEGPLPPNADPIVELGVLRRLIEG
jgi:lipoyl(octanoyl) transferase